MSNFALIGLSGEGATDERFLSGVVKRTFDDIAFECDGEIETALHLLQIQHQNFTDWVFKSSNAGLKEFGISILCIHTDSDAADDSQVFSNKIVPALTELEKQAEDLFCKVVSIAVPIQMVEAWLLADKELLKLEIGTDKSDDELRWNKAPETYSDPKKIIEDAIRIGWEHRSRRQRGHISLGELYQPIGAKISLAKLRELPSFRKFEESVRSAYRKLNFLHDQ